MASERQAQQVTASLVSCAEASLPPQVALWLAGVLLTIRAESCVYGCEVRVLVQTVDPPFVSGSRIDLLVSAQR